VVPSFVGTWKVSPSDGEGPAGQAVGEAADGRAEVAAGEAVGLRVGVAEDDVEGGGRVVSEPQAAHGGAGREHLELDAVGAQRDRLGGGGVGWVEDAGGDDGIRVEGAVDVRKLLSRCGIGDVPAQGGGEPVGVDGEQDEVAVVGRVVAAEDSGDLLRRRAVDEAFVLEGSPEGALPVLAGGECLLPVLGLGEVVDRVGRGHCTGLGEGA
jgi:hypothetical protein